MAKRFFRLQETGISFEDMQEYNSEDGGDGFTEGLCVSDRPDRFGGAEGAYKGDAGEVVIMEGRILNQIYDGYRIYPTKEIARFAVGQWESMLEDGTAWDWE